MKNLSPKGSIQWSPTSMRLNKYLARAGVCSRRAADDLIKDGKVTVNNQVAKLTTVVKPLTDKVVYQGRKITLASPVLYLFHKPPGVICSRAKKSPQEKSIYEYFPPQPDLISIGRLDKDSEGLLLVTNDGDLAQTLMHPKFAHCKKYIVWTNYPKLDLATLKHRLNRGIKIKGQNYRFDKVKIMGKSDNLLKLELTLHQGISRQIRRMLGRIGLTVIRLKRVEFSDYKLGKLPSGKYRKLTIFGKTKEIVE
jgi:pseudouridine synthase